jgi:hypothetical protein
MNTNKYKQNFICKNELDDVTHNASTNESSSKIGEKKIRLKTFIKGNKIFPSWNCKCLRQKTQIITSNHLILLKMFRIVINKVYNDTVNDFKVEIPEKNQQKKHF